MSIICKNCYTCEKCFSCEIGTVPSQQPQQMPPQQPITCQVRGRQQPLQLPEKFQGITIWNTALCNMNCAYCFVYKLYPNQPNRSLSDEVINALPNFVKKYMTDNPEIWFFGGEPLASFDTIKKVFNVLTENNIIAHYGLTSNLTLLDEEKARWLGERRFGILCSIDGGKESHNMNRVYKDGKGTWDDVMKGLKLVRQYINPSPNIRWTVEPRNVKYVYEDVKEFFGMGLTTLAIDPVYEVEWKDEDVEEYMNQLEKVAQYIIHTHHTVALKPFQDLLPLLSVQPIEWRYRCGLAQGSLGMGVDGKLHLCFTPDTFVITDNGVKDIIDIKEGEMVLTHSGSYRKVKNLMKRYYEGFIYVVKPYLLPEIKCTPEHPFYIKIGKEYKWIEASELSKYVSRRIGKGAKEDEIAYFVSKIDKVVEDVESIKLNEMLDNLYYNPKEDKVIEVGSTKPVRNTIPVDDKFLEFIGWFVTEGSLSARDGQISFAFNLEKEMSVAEKIKGYLEWLGCKVSLYVDENHHSIHLGTYNRVVYEFLKTLVGMGAENKRLNMLLKRLPPEKQVKLVHSIFKGDGMWYRKEAVLSTVSRQLAIDVYEILLRLGIIPKFKIYRRKRGWNNKLYTEYRVFIYGCEKDMINQNTRDRGRAFIDLDKGEVYYPIYSIEKKDYKGFVYNLEVEEDESYTANLVVAHNCHRFVSSQSGVIGDVFNGIDQNVRKKYNEEYWKVRPYSKTLDCGTCPLQEMCNGGCLAVNYDMNKDMHVIPESFCKIYQAYVKRLLPYVLIMKARGQLMIRKDRIVNVPPE